MSATIPFSRPVVTEKEPDLVAQALASGHVSGDGPFTERAVNLLSPLVGGGHCLLTPSCTHALEAASLLLDLGPGDEVIMPSFTFVSTANAVAIRGATPVFVDCRPDTFNLDDRRIEDAITERTRAITVMHYGGVACAMDVIEAIARRHGLAIIEDNAHGLDATYRGRALGSFGDLAAQSFHATKNVSCGEGGALVVNETRLAERAEIIREKGTDRRRFLRGEVDKYRWVEVGSSYLLSDVLAAVLTAQLEALGAMQARRHAVWDRYDTELADWRAEHGAARQHVPEDCAHPAHVFAMLLPTHAARNALLAHLGTRGVQATFHYVPLDSAPAGLEAARTADGGCPVTADVADRLIRLPLYPDLAATEVDRVVAAVAEFRP